MVATRPLAAITGASAGLGSEFARQLAARGYDLLLVARRTDRLQSLCKELTQTSGVNAEAITVDLAEPAEVDALAARLAGEARLALLVNNAGFGTLGRYFETEPEGQARMHMVHVVATAKLTRAVLAPMVERNAGAIINVASVAGFLMTPGNVSYCSTKTWMNAFTEGLYLELRGSRTAVKVQALCPGFTYTEFHDAMGVKRDSIPKWMWLDGSLVVSESLRGLDRGKLFVIPSWEYKVYVAILKLVPRWLYRVLAARYGETYRNYYRHPAENKSTTRLD
jgi:uncharacterized protein